MIELIIFDWDDVITLGSKEGYFACYDKVLKELKIPRNATEEKKRILSKWGGSHQETLKELLKEYPNLIDKACEIYEENLFGDTFINEISVINGIQDILEKLAKTYPLAIVSGVHPFNLKRITAKFRIPDVFTQIITSYDLNNPLKAKPHPYMIQKILGTQNIESTNTIFVGDASSDVVMAKAAKVIPVVVLTGHLDKKSAEKMGVEYIVRDVTKLEKVLQNLNNPS